MKRYFILVLLSLCSCTKFLTEDPRSSISEEAAYSTASRIFNNAVAGLYSYVGGNSDSQGLQGTYMGVYDLNTFSTDEAMIPLRGNDWADGQFWFRLHTHAWTTSESALKNTWNYLYKVVAFSNKSLDVIKNSDKPDSLQKLKWSAEVRAFRAIYYCYIMDLFGNVPIVTSLDVSMDEVVQHSRTEVYKFIKSELEDVLDNLYDAKSAQYGEYYGRVTKSVALFALAKLCLNAEVYTGKSEYADCIKYCNLLYDSDLSLEEFYYYNFYTYNENSEENIFTIPMDKRVYSAQFRNLTRSLHQSHCLAYGQTGENGSCATREALMVYGVDFNEEDIDLMTKNADPRLQYNYFYGTQVGPDDKPIVLAYGDTLVYYPDQAYPDLSNTDFVQTGGARMFKYWLDTSSGLRGRQPSNDIVLFRFADVVLMRAEAILRGLEDGSISGYTTLDAQKDFDAIRERVAADERKVSLDNILDERLMELAWEGWRRNDLVRFGEFDIDEDKNIFPIPSDILASNGNLSQNPGY